MAAEGDNGHILTVYHIHAEDGPFVVDNLDLVRDIVLAELESLNCLGDEVTVTVRQGEMTRGDFEALPDG